MNLSQAERQPSFSARLKGKQAGFCSMGEWKTGGNMIESRQFRAEDKEGKLSGKVLDKKPGSTAPKRRLISVGGVPSHHRHGRKNGELGEVLAVRGHESPGIIHLGELAKLERR